MLRLRLFYEDFQYLARAVKFCNPAAQMPGTWLLRMDLVQHREVEHVEAITPIPAETQRGVV